MKKILPLPKTPKFRDHSPRVVQILDKIRFELNNIEDYKYDEFCWFIWEYPRAYRYHLDCAEYRLKSILEKYNSAYSYFSKQLLEDSINCFQMSKSNHMIYEIYWDF